MISAFIFLLFLTLNLHTMDDQARYASALEQLASPQEGIRGAGLSNLYNLFTNSMSPAIKAQAFIAWVETMSLIIKGPFSDATFNKTEKVFSELPDYVIYLNEFDTHRVSTFLQNIIKTDAFYILEMSAIQSRYGVLLFKALAAYKNIPTFKNEAKNLFDGTYGLRRPFTFKEVIETIITNYIAHNELDQAEEATRLLYKNLINLFSPAIRRDLHKTLLLPLAQKYIREQKYTEALALLELVLQDTQLFLNNDDFKNILSTLFETVFTITNSASTVADLELPTKVLTDMVAYAKVDIKFKQEAQGYLLETAQFYVNQGYNNKALMILEPLIRKQRSILPDHKAYAQRLMRQIQTEPSVKKQKS